MFRVDRSAMLQQSFRGLIPVVGVLAFGALMTGGASADSHPNGLAANGRPAHAGALIPTNINFLATPIVPSGPVVGESFTARVRVTRQSNGNGIPAGTVTFSISPSAGTSVCSPVTVSDGTGSNPPAGVATCSITASAPGAYTVSASYGGATVGANTAQPSGPTTTPVTVAKGDSKITPTAPTGIVTGQAFDLSATVVAKAPASGTPSGTVHFLTPPTNPNVELCNYTNADLTTSHSCNVPAGLNAGTYAIKGHYDGDTNFNADNGQTSITIAKGDTTTAITQITPSSLVTGQLFNVQAAVSAKSPAVGTPTGTLDIVRSDTSATLCTITLPAISCNVAGGLPASGSPYTLYAHYNGDANFNASVTTNEAATQQVVNKGDTTTSMTLPATHPVTGQPFDIGATVAVVAPATGTPTGTIDILETAPHAVTLCTITLPATSCNVPGGLPAADSPYTLHAHYNGDANFNGSSSANDNLIVDKGDTTTAVSISGNRTAGETFTLSVAVKPVAPAAGVPTGKVSIMDNAGHQCTITLSGGVGTCDLKNFEAGRYTFHAYYLGDANFNGSVDVTRSVRITKPMCGAITKYPYCDERGDDVGRSPKF